MPISIACPSCGHGKDVPDAFEGRRVKCPKCGNTLAVSRQGARPASNVNLSSSMRPGLTTGGRRRTTRRTIQEHGPRRPVFGTPRGAVIVALGIGLILLILGAIFVALAMDRNSWVAQVAAHEEALRQAQEARQAEQEGARRDVAERDKVEQAKRESALQEQARREAAERDKVEQAKRDSEKKRREEEAWNRPLSDDDKTIADFLQDYVSTEQAKRFEQSARQLRKQAEKQGVKLQPGRSATELAKRFRMQRERDGAWFWLPVPAQRLLDDYRRNEVAADKVWKGNWIHVEGAAVRVGHVLDQYFLILRGHGKELGFTQVQCFFDKEEADQLVNVKTDEPDGTAHVYEVVGQCDGMSFNVVLKHCTGGKLKKTEGP